VRWPCSFRSLAERLTLILASASPQRRAILGQLGIPFQVVVSGAEELEQGPAEEVAVENARRKAISVAGRHPGALVLGADTVVSLDDRLYGKPAGVDGAAEMLRALSGRRHTVVGGVCLIEGDRIRTAVARTEVRFRELSDSLLDWYLGSGEWAERAGAYAIQGRGAALVESVDGDYLNVVGLPVSTLLALSPELLG
jgi:septum formation protein